MIYFWCDCEEEVCVKSCTHTVGKQYVVNFLVLDLILRYKNQWANNMVSTFLSSSEIEDRKSVSFDQIVAK